MAFNFKVYSRLDDNQVTPGNPTGATATIQGTTAAAGGLPFFVPGDTWTLEFNGLKRLCELTAIIRETTNESNPDRVIDITFQWSQDGTTYSSAVDFTTVNVAAVIGIDEDEPFFLRLIAVRAGSVADVGVIWLKNVGITYQFTGDAVNDFFIRPVIQVDTPGNSTGLSWAKRPEWYGDIATIMGSILQYVADVTNDGTRDQAVVKFAHPDKCVPDYSKFVIYHSDIKEKAENRNNTNDQITLQIRVGIRRDCGKVLQMTDTKMDIIKACINEQFGPSWRGHVYDTLLWRGYEWKSVNFYDAGIRSSRTFGSSERDIGKCGCTWWETVVELVLYTPRLLTNNNISF